MPHTTPTDLHKKLAASTAMKAAWDDTTPLARNEWICWIISAKKAETRARRIDVACEQLREGKRRPCCWAGCPHR